MHAIVALIVLAALTSAAAACKPAPMGCTDPQPGDVVTSTTNKFSWPRTVTKRQPDDVFFEVTDKSGVTSTRKVWLKNWKRWCRVNRVRVDTHG